MSLHAAQLNDAPSVGAKTSAFPSLLYSQDTKHKLCPPKNPKIEVFIANNSLKVFGGPKFGMRKIVNLS